MAFTGAGVSTLSGVRDFRGKNGLYSTAASFRIFDINWFLKDPSIFYSAGKDFIYNLEKIKPSLVHTELSRLEKKGLIKSVITQNIDRLHRKAGSENLIELHGSPELHRCMDCGRTICFAEACHIVNSGKIPYCGFCGGILKPDIIFFGEQLPAEVLSDAAEEAMKADLLLVLGSSLSVQPAASIPAYTLQAGRKIVIINNMETSLDSSAVLRYHDLGEVFNYISEKL